MCGFTLYKLVDIGRSDVLQEKYWEFSAQTGSFDVLRSHIQGFAYGNPGYTQDSARARALVERYDHPDYHPLTRLMMKRIQWWAYSGDQRYGFEADAKTAEALSGEILRSEPRNNEITYRHEGDLIGQLKDQPTKARELIEKMAKTGSHRGQEELVRSTFQGINDFECDVKEAMRLGIEFANQGNYRLRWMMFDYLSHARGGIEYPVEKDEKRAYELNMQWFVEGDSEALQRLVNGHLQGTYGYPKDQSALFVILDKHNPRSANCLRAIFHTFGLFGYPKDLEAARALVTKYFN